ncbi:MAG: stage V sporulation protein D [Bacillota bacterium]
MSNVKRTVKKRLLIMLAGFFAIYVALIGRLVFIQIVNSSELRQKAIEQWTNDTVVKSKRGIIYDRNGKELAVSATAYEVSVSPANVEDPDALAQALSDVLGMNKEDLLNKVTAQKSSVTIKKNVDSEKIKQLMEMNFKGVKYTPGSMRFYPQANFASYILGFTNIDNEGADGVELTYNKYLNGYPGRIINMYDAHGRELPGSDTKYFEPQDGLNLVLTVDEVIQHFAEKHAENALAENKAKRVTAIVMDPQNGDILAMAIKSDYDNNDPRKVPENLSEQWSTMTPEQRKTELEKIWRNPAISDTYEPGSTFKIITSAVGIEEKTVAPDDHFHCSGFVKVGGRTLKCWRNHNPHGSQTFVEGVMNSCNPVFMAVADKLGAEKFYKYIRAFGFGSKTNISLPGEGEGIVRATSQVGPVELATTSFGQGISVTPMQLITAVSAIANGGKLMEPRIAKKLVDNEGKTVYEFEPKVVRQVISKETSDTMRNILEQVVANGTGKKAYVPGYKVAGKTGTAQKVIEGRYAEGKYISSFVGFAPADDPRIIILVIIDEPGGAIYYGGQIAAPVVQSIASDTLRYLDVKPQFTAEELEQMQKPIVDVPEVRNMTLLEAIEALKKSGLKYTVEGEVDYTINSLVLDQTPKAGAKVNEGNEIILAVKPIAQ